MSVISSWIGFENGFRINHFDRQPYYRLLARAAATLAYASLIQCDPGNSYTMMCVYINAFLHINNRWIIHYRHNSID